MDQIGQSDLRACLDAVLEIGAASAQLVSFMFNRAGGGLGERDRQWLETIRPHLGDLQRVARAMEDAHAAWGVPGIRGATPSTGATLTPREREVLRYLAGGKTDRDIGDILGISPRTVHKHLQRIYEKLGVETRTAAVVRAIGLAA